MAGRTLGEAWVTISPDTAGFRAALDSQLKKAMAGLKPLVKVNVELNADTARLRTELSAALKDFKAKVNVEADASSLAKTDAALKAATRTRHARVEVDIAQAQGMAIEIDKRFNAKAMAAQMAEAKALNQLFDQRSAALDKAQVSATQLNNAMDSAALSDAISKLAASRQAYENQAAAMDKAHDAAIRLNTALDAAQAAAMAKAQGAAIEMNVKFDARNAALGAAQVAASAKVAQKAMADAQAEGNALNKVFDQQAKEALAAQAATDKLNRSLEKTAFDAPLAAAELHRLQAEASSLNNDLAKVLSPSGITSGKIDHSSFEELENLQESLAKVRAEMGALSTTGIVSADDVSRVGALRSAIGTLSSAVAANGVTVSHTATSYHGWVNTIISMARIQIPLFNGAFTKMLPHFLSFASGTHLMTEALIETLAVWVPATVAFGTFAAAAYKSSKQVVSDVMNMHTAAMGTGQAFAGMSAKAGKSLSDMAKPYVYTAYGLALDALAKKSTTTGTVIQNVGSTIDRWITEAVVAYSKGTGKMALNGSNEFAILGDSFKQLGTAIEAFLKMTPGYAIDLLKLGDGFLHLASAILNNPIVQWLGTIALKFHGAFFYIGLATTLFTKLGMVLLRPLANIKLFSGALSAMGVEASGTQGKMGAMVSAISSGWSEGFSGIATQTRADMTLINATITESLTDAGMSGEQATTLMTSKIGTALKEGLMNGAVIVETGLEDLIVELDDAFIKMGYSPAEARALAKLTIALESGLDDLTDEAKAGIDALIEETAAGFEEWGDEATVAATKAMVRMTAGVDAAYTSLGAMVGTRITAMTAESTALFEAMGTSNAEAIALANAKITAAMALGLSEETVVAGGAAKVAAGFKGAFSGMFSSLGVTPFMGALAAVGGAILLLRHNMEGYAQAAQNFVAAADTALGNTTGIRQFGSVMNTQLVAAQKNLAATKKSLIEVDNNPLSMNPMSDMVNGVTNLLGLGKHLPETVQDATAAYAGQENAVAHLVGENQNYQANLKAIAKANKVDLPQAFALAQEAGLSTTDMMKDQGTQMYENVLETQAASRAYASLTAGIGGVKTAYSALNIENSQTLQSAQAVASALASYTTLLTGGVGAFDTFVQGQETLNDNLKTAGGNTAATANAITSYTKTLSDSTTKTKGLTSAGKEYASTSDKIGSSTTATSKVAGTATITLGKLSHVLSVAGAALGGTSAASVTANQAFLAQVNSAQSLYGQLLQLAAASGNTSTAQHQVSMAGKDMISSLLNTAAGSKSAMVQVYALAQTFGYAGKSTLPALVSWLGKTGDRTQDLQSRVNALTAAAGNLASSATALSGSIGKQLQNSMAMSIIVAEGGQKAFNTLAKAVGNYAQSGSQASLSGVMKAGEQVKQTFIDASGSASAAVPALESYFIQLGVKNQAQAKAMAEQILGLGGNVMQAAKQEDRATLSAINMALAHAILTTTLGKAQKAGLITTAQMNLLSIAVVANKDKVDVSKQSFELFAEKLGIAQGEADKLWGSLKNVAGNYAANVDVKVSGGGKVTVSDYVSGGLGVLSAKGAATVGKNNNYTMLHRSTGGKIPGWHNTGDNLLAISPGGPIGLQGGEAIVPKNLATHPGFTSFAKNHGIPGFSNGGLIAGGVTGNLWNSGISSLMGKYGEPAFAHGIGDQVSELLTSSVQSGIAAATAAGINSNAPMGHATYGSMLNNGKAIFEYLIANAGMTPQAAAGAIASIWGESTWNPESQGDGGRGLIAWSPASTLVNSAFTGNQTSDLNSQLPQIIKFIGNSGDWGTISRMNAASSSDSLDQLAEMWGKGVEKYGIDDVHSEGLYYAQQILNDYLSNKSHVTQGGATPGFADGGKILAFGASTTHGTGATSGFSYVDDLSRALAGKFSVENAGIVGNELTQSGKDGPAGDKRFKALLKGIKAAIVWEGNDDISAGVAAPAIIKGYQEIIEEAHAKNVSVVGGTLQPGGFTGQKEAQRQAVNKWILSDKNDYDAVADIDRVLRDPKHPNHMADWVYNQGQHHGIHPGNAGYASVAGLFEAAVNDALAHRKNPKKHARDVVTSGALTDVEPIAPNNRVDVLVNALTTGKWLNFLTSQKGSITPFGWAMQPALGDLDLAKHFAPSTWIGKPASDQDAQDAKTNYYEAQDAVRQYLNSVANQGSMALAGAATGIHGRDAQGRKFKLGGMINEQVEGWGMDTGLPYTFHANERVVGANQIPGTERGGTMSDQLLMMILAELQNNTGATRQQGREMGNAINANVGRKIGRG